MLNILERVRQLKSALNIDQILHVIVGIVIFLSVIQATMMCLKPINIEKYNNIVLLSEQARFPQTQLMANQILLRDQIYTIDYVRLMFAHQQESAEIREYPAMKLEDE
ncbi:hypothetical protein EC844_11744 [Acinetobacter calcoaceticus]|uniref:Uncharacterized protein n=1 Tax=Acinetobacter calcoaceticus TaxID=471 RepID=A0A4R1XR72_ACICA|nr:hypothetical protein EC844_11744 [Acinetobacter calcoaceticus]